MYIVKNYLFLVDIPFLFLQVIKHLQITMFRWWDGSIKHVIVNQNVYDKYKAKIGSIINSIEKRFKCCKNNITNIWVSKEELFAQRRIIYTELIWRHRFRSRYFVQAVATGTIKLL